MINHKVKPDRVLLSIFILEKDKKKSLPGGDKIVSEYIKLDSKINAVSIFGCNILSNDISTNMTKKSIKFVDSEKLKTH